MILSRSSAPVVALLVVLSLLGSTFSQAGIGACSHDLRIASASHVGRQITPASRPVDLAAGNTCDGVSCGMIDCCFPDLATIDLGAPATASSSLPLLLATAGSGNEPAEAEHPPKAT
ncbi:MAG: hypothetical protein ACTHJ3_10310 [Pararhizobium sp.]